MPPADSPRLRDSPGNGPVSPDRKRLELGTPEAGGPSVHATLAPTCLNGARIGFLTPL